MKTNTREILAPLISRLRLNHHISTSDRDWAIRIIENYICQKEDMKALGDLLRRIQDE